LFGAIRSNISDNEDEDSDDDKKSDDPRNIQAKYSSVAVR
jgi:hypothetical protein